MSDLHWTQAHPRLGRFAYRVMRAIQYTMVGALVIAAIVIAAAWK